MRQPEFQTRFHYPPITDAEVRDGCYLTSMGHTRHPAGRSYPTPGHPEQYTFDANKGRVFSDFGLVLIREGQGVFQGESGEEEMVEAGDFLCLAPGRWHRYAPDMQTGWEEFWLCFNGDYPHRLLANGQLPRSSCLVRPQHGASYRRRLRLILEGVDAADLTTTLGMGLRALALFTEISASVLSGKNGAPAEGAGLCASAMAWIRDNRHRNIDMEQLANHFGVSRRTLERHFRQDAGLSPRTYLIRCRVERARALIERTDMPMKSVAFAAGFSSPQQMIYDFQRQLGLAPGMLRKQA